MAAILANGRYWASNFAFLTSAPGRTETLARVSRKRSLPDPLRSFATDRFREANPGMIEVAGLFRQVHLAQKCLEARIGAEAFQFRFQF
jgi:hypothetical protein